MGLRFCSFASGSTGNCYLIRTDNTALLVDCGISGKRIMEGLGRFGLDACDLSAILITHEHSDHIMSIRMMARKAENADIYATGGTILGIGDKVPDGRITRITSGELFNVGDIEVMSFDVSHDAREPVGYTFTCEGRKLSILTDTGTVTEKIYRSVKASNALVLEANHEVNILRAGPYPFELQQRILSDRGHLSNVAAGELICRLLDDRGSIGTTPEPIRDQRHHFADDVPSDGGYDAAGDAAEEDRDIPYVLLAHISRNNNTPYQAMLTVKDILFEDDLYVGRDLNMSTASYCEIGPEIEV